MNCSQVSAYNIDVKVKKRIILSKLQNGETTQQVAEYFEVSRQTIDQHRKKFIAQGLLPNKRGGKFKRTNEDTVEGTKTSQEYQTLISTIIKYFLEIENPYSSRSRRRYWKLLQFLRQKGLDLS